MLKPPPNVFKPAGGEDGRFGTIFIDSDGFFGRQKPLRGDSTSGAAAFEGGEGFSVAVVFPG
jgi:hypothetical protein